MGQFRSEFDPEIDWELVVLGGTITSGCEVTWFERTTMKPRGLKCQTPKSLMNSLTISQPASSTTSWPVNGVMIMGELSSTICRDLLVSTMLLKNGLRQIHWKPPHWSKVLAKLCWEAIGEKARLPNLFKRQPKSHQQQGTRTSGR